MNESDQIVFSGSKTVSSDELGRIRTEALKWNEKASEFFGTRDEWGKRRFCQWKHQSSDGRIYNDKENGITVKPFHGASDQRLRWGDGIVLHKLSLMCVALNMAKVQVTASGADKDRGRRLALVLRAMIQGLESRWLRSWVELLQYYLGDSPAVALMGLDWTVEQYVDFDDILIEEVEAAYVVRGVNNLAALGADVTTEEEGAIRERFWEMMNGGDSRAASDAPELIDLVVDGWDLERSEAKRVLNELREERVAEIEVIKRGYEGPVITPGRLGDDFLLPTGAQDFESVPVWFVTEWLSNEELQERVETDGWDQDWVDGVISDDSQPVMQDAWSVTEQTDMREGMHQVVWAYHQAVSSRGVMGRYEIVFGAGEGTAFGRRMLRGTRGKWPAVFFQRERLNNLMLDSRGVVEIVSPSEGVAKKLRDSGADNGIIGNLPPVLQKGRSIKNKFIGPLERVQMRVNEEFSFMNPPAYPASGNKTLEQIWDGVVWYFGLTKEDERNPPLGKHEVHWFLAQVWDFMNRMIALAQDNASDQWLSEVVNEQGVAEGLSREDIIGAASVRLSLDIDDMDAELVIKKMEAVGNVLMRMDTSKTMDTAPIVAHGMQVLFPDIPDGIKPVDKALEDEIKAERNNIVLIRAGIMPEVNTEGGWNYDLRLGVYEQMLAENPQAFDDLSDDKLMILEQWMKVLNHQAEQYGDNRQIGRTGASGVKEV